VTSPVSGQGTTKTSPTAKQPVTRKHPGKKHVAKKHVPKKHVAKKHPKKHVHKKPVHKKHKHKTISPFSMKVNPNNFYYALGSYESGNNYHSVNTIYCAGRWQFCPTWIGGPGWGKYNGNVWGWTHHPAYQNQKMLDYTAGHWNSLVRAGAKNYLCQNRVSAHGERFKVTESGMLAGAHLGGVYGVERFLKTGYDSHDAYGTYITDYMAWYARSFVPGKWADLYQGKTSASCYISPLYNWASRQVGKKNHPWKAGQGLKFVDDGLQAVGLQPLRKMTPAEAWRAYAAAGRGHKWGSKGLRRGDLVFWGAGAGGFSATGNVGIYAGKGKIIDDFNGTIRKDKIGFVAPRHGSPSGFVHARPPK
jgi:hypothetical protein